MDLVEDYLLDPPEMLDLPGNHRGVNSPWGERPEIWDKYWEITWPGPGLLTSVYVMKKIPPPRGFRIVK